MPNEVLLEACEKVGGQTALATRIGVTQSMVWYWIEKAKRGVPAHYVMSIEDATGIPRYRLRPDIYPVPKRRVAA